MKEKPRMYVIVRRESFKWPRVIFYVLQFYSRSELQSDE
jgi:hypothetical protein